jgi:hypothetical protein
MTRNPSTSIESPSTGSTPASSSFTSLTSGTAGCTVSDRRIDPFETVGIAPEHPMPYWGLGLTYPTSTAATGTATIVNHRHRLTRTDPTYR